MPDVSKKKNMLVNIRWGEVFCVSSTTEQTEYHWISSNITRTTFKGKGIRWYVCDNCMKKGYDRSWIKFIIISILTFIGINSGIFNDDSQLTATLLLVSIGSGIIGIAELIWFWMIKDSEWRSKYSRDNVISDNIGQLRSRQDFINEYGKIDLIPNTYQRTMTRYQFGKIK